MGDAGGLSPRESKLRAETGVILPAGISHVSGILLFKIPALWRVEYVTEFRDSSSS